MTDDTRSDDPTTPLSESECAETIRELDVFLDGEITEEQRAAIREHLDGCLDCLGAFDFHAELKQVIAHKCQNDEIPPDLVSRIERCFDIDFDGDGQIG